MRSVGYQNAVRRDWQASLDASFASRRIQRCLSQFDKFSGLVQRTLGNFVAHRNCAIVGLVSAWLQVVEDTGNLTSEDWTLTDKSPGTFGGNLAMLPVIASWPVVSKGEECSDGSWKAVKYARLTQGSKAC